MLLKLGIIAVLGSLVGFALVHGIMLIRILKSKPPARIAIGECLAELLMSARAKDYMRLLSETKSKPTFFDHAIYTLERLIGWCLAVGIVMVALGLIRAVGSPNDPLGAISAGVFGGIGGAIGGAVGGGWGAAVGTAVGVTLGIRFGSVF